MSASSLPPVVLNTDMVIFEKNLHIRYDPRAILMRRADT
jgi:hypothetical protein